MSIFEKVINSIQFQIHKATSDPKAEAFAKKNADAAKQKEELAAKKADEATKKVDKAAAEKEKEDKKAALRQEAKDRNTFSFTRLFGTVFSTTLGIVFIFLIFFGAVLGSSLATNLNLYHSAPYRIFYAIYGFIFFFLVIPYVLLYRWFWKGKRPKFYSLIPLIPYHLDNRWTALLFGWLSYKPDDQIASLQEWIKEQGEHGGHSEQGAE